TDVLGHPRILCERVDIGAAESGIGDVDCDRDVDLIEHKLLRSVNNSRVTGGAGSARDIESALVATGLGWDAVGHVILTHAHGDHVGSLPEVLDRAADATAYALTRNLV
ncbi:MAG: MBL fold metallo-hydrolase, partial [Chloroflexi bacterium]|nr:MBL fold metallo-hydrolase [Chloroflexota bacterium]